MIVVRFSGGCIRLELGRLGVCQNKGDIQAGATVIRLISMERTALIIGLVFEDFFGAIIASAFTIIGEFNLNVSIGAVA